jgi:hypothetical protein
LKTDEFGLGLRGRLFHQPVSRALTITPVTFVDTGQSPLDQEFI